VGSVFTAGGKEGLSAVGDDLDIDQHGEHDPMVVVYAYTPLPTIAMVADA
jgi:hypothetical protein